MTMILRRFLVFWAICGGVLISISLAADDLYDTLGVDRSATTHEIRKAYKKLARELHPDKNKAPDANDKFMKINEAYEILTDKGRRKEYDNFGHVNFHSPDPHQARREDFNHFNDFFGGFGNFRFDFGGENYNKYHMTYRSYRMNIKEETYKRPYFIFVTGHMCLHCAQLEPLWERIVSDIETIGLGIGTFHQHNDIQLTNEFKVYHYPQFLAVVNGRPLFYRGAENIQGLRDFVRSFFPSNLVAKVTDHTYEQFLSGWSDNKVRVLLFGQQDVVPLRYMALAFEFKDRVQAAYVKFGSETREMEAAYRVQPNKETMFVFGEDFKNAMATASMSRLTRATMNDLVSANKYLLLPRLSCQNVFNELCPIEASKNLRKLCIILVTSKMGEHDAARDAYRAHARAFTNQRVQHRSAVQFAYIYQDVQSDFAEKMALWKRPRNESVLQVVILWRSSSKTVSYEWLRDGWAVHADDVIDSQRQLNNQLEELLHHKKVLAHTAKLPLLEDEHAQVVLVRMWYKILDWWDYVYDKLNLFDKGNIYYLILTSFFFSVVGYVMNALMQAENERVSEEEFQRTGRRPPPPPDAPTDSKPPEKTVFIRELRPGNFESMFVKAEPGSMCLVILVDKESKCKLLQQFGKLVLPYAHHSVLSFAYLLTDDHIDWYKQLLTESLSSPNLERLNPKNVIGTVLAVNGHRRYYCMYHAKHPQRGRTKRKRRPLDFIGLEEEESGESHDETTQGETRLFHEELLTDLPNWFDRLYEGSLRRIKVEEWPMMF